MFSLLLNSKTSLLDGVFAGNMPYPLPAMIALILGTLIWTYLYLTLAYRGFKYKFVEMPAFAACANIAWEFLWGFVFREEHNIGVIIADGTAFLIDVLIFYNLLRYNAQYQPFKLAQQYFIPLCVFGVAAWGAALYFFQKQGYDLSGGGNSAYILDAAIAILYVQQLLRFKSIALLSYAVAWCKLTGNFFCVIFMLIVFPDDHFVQVLMFTCLIFDLIYLVLFIKMRKNPNYLNQWA